MLSRGADDGTSARGGLSRRTVINCSVLRTNRSRDFLPISSPVTQTTQKRPRKIGGAFAWCGRRDLNPHELLHWNLKPARLPIPPRPHIFRVLAMRTLILYHTLFRLSSGFNYFAFLLYISLKLLIAEEKSSIAPLITAGSVISIPATSRLSIGDFESPHLRNSIYLST